MKKKAAPKKTAPKKSAKAKATKPKRREYRPRVQIAGDVATFGERSPWKGRVTRANPEEKPNPGYTHEGASFDLFGGESRKIHKPKSEFSRPRVRVRGKTMTLAAHSPFKGQVERVNPSAHYLTRPVRVELDAKEVKAWKADPEGFARSIMSAAARHRPDYDHLEAVDRRGKHLFDLVR